MKERAQELMAQGRRGRGAEDGERAVLAKIAEMPAPDRAMAERLHAIIQVAAPVLTPKTWYGMPAYANPDGKVVCYFTPASKFKERYATLGFNAAAHLDEGLVNETLGCVLKDNEDMRRFRAEVSRAGLAAFLPART